MTIREALIEANTKISPLDSSLLLIFVLSQRHGGAEGAEKNFSRTDLLIIGDDPISNDEVDIFKVLVERRRNGECVAYITGKKEFWGLDFFVNKNVLVPRPETEILVERSLEFLTTNHTNNTKRVLDLCTGSGAIAITLKHEIPELDVYAADISAEALEVAEKNEKRLLQNNKNITFLQGDLYSAISPAACCLLPAAYSLIVSNPPYIPTNKIETLSPEVQNEPRLALDGGKTGLDIIERIIESAPVYLQRGGRLLLEADPRQMEKIKFLLANRGFKDIIINKDLAGFDRVIGGKI